jgi:hypothetical protein
MTLTISHNSGFFSCSSVRLTEIINFFNNNKVLPDLVDSSRQYSMFKDDLSDDLTKIIYSDNDKKIDYLHDVQFTSSLDETQFSNYNQINFKDVNPFVEKYFSTTDIVNKQIEFYIQKYGLDLSKTIGVFYRGNDKVRETNVGFYEIYLHKMYKALYRNPGFTILIQTDDQDFINFCYGKIPFICFSEMIRIPNDVRHVVHYYIRNKVEFSINFLAVTKIMSMCNILITHSGNCGLWAVLYRQNTNNVSQYLNHNNKGEVWYDSYS